MTFIVRRPAPKLAPFVESFWYFTGELAHGRERVLPSGTAQLLVNLHEDELRWYDDRVHRVAGAAFMGAHDRPFSIDTEEQRAILGVNFRPGGAFPFFDPKETSGLHVALEDLWGRQGRLFRERLLEERTPDARLALLERLLLVHAKRFTIDPAIAFAVGALEEGARVGAVVERLGMTPRRFIRTFEERVGLAPKRFARVRRFQRVLAADRAFDWAAIAAQVGYSDQAHLIHEFALFTGETPTAYRPRVDASNHVPLPG
ncbi:MAG: AraC family transcriptional regulator [Kofleriaceae bacterium]|nr:AraC family transcriptional regulator [Kofleriaceae bacterium]